MKKRLCLMLALGIIGCTSLSANAFNWKFWNKDNSSNQAVEVKASSDFEILPTMNSVSNAKNQVWVGTFQLVWNDLIDEIIKRPVVFVHEKSVMADNLNKKAFTVNDLSEDSYYKKLGLASPAMKKEIEKGIKEKFNETSDILDSFDWTPAPKKYILYAMLKKDFEYLKPFDKLPESNFVGSEGLVKYFGVSSQSSAALKSTVNVLFYNDNNDFAVKLTSKAGDQVYLYRTDDKKTLDVLYSDMLDKSKSYKGNKRLGREDELKVPMMDFKSERKFPELCNKAIKASDFIIEEAIETVQFKMDETGVKLKSEAGIMAKMSALMPDDMPRYFYFNNRYIIFLAENGKTTPYFAMKVEDVKKLQK